MLTIEGPVPHRVYQRNSDGNADIAFGVNLSSPCKESLSVKAIARHEDREWSVVGRPDSLHNYSGVIRGLPAGAYRLSFRIGYASSDEVLKEIVVDPVFVGDLWLLAGQSNMEGCGTLLGEEEACEGVSCFYLDDRWDLAEDPLCWFHEAVDPVHWNVPPEQLEEARRKDRQLRSRGAGLGVAFGKELLRAAGVPVGLIMCAHGGTGMKEWDPDWAYRGGHSLYGSMLRRVEAVGGSVKGCLWYQGESDANAEQGPMYAERFEQFVARLREDLGNPEMLLVYAQLAVFHTWNKEHEKWWNYVQHQQLLAEDRLQPCALIPTIDATLSDPIHLDAASLKKIGRRFAWQALRLVYGESRPSGPRPVAYEWNKDRSELIVKLVGMNGSLLPVKQAFGFYLEADGERWDPCSAVLTENRDAVVLRFIRPAPHDSRLFHGQGYYPAVNIMDELGIPLPVMGPVDVP